MGNSLCARPLPTNLYNTTEAETPGEDSRKQLMGLVFAHRIMKAPILDLKKNTLYKSRQRANTPSQVINS